MAIQNKIYIGFASNIKEWLTTPEDFVKQVEKERGIFLFIVIKSEDKEAFQNEYKTTFIDKIYDKRSCSFTSDGDTYQETIEDLKYEIEKKRMCNENTEVFVVKNTEFYNIIKDAGIVCKAISETECLTPQKPKTSGFGADAFIASMMQRKQAIDNAGVNNKKKINVDPPPTKPINTENSVLNPPPSPQTNAEILKNKSSLMGKLPVGKVDKPDNRTLLELEKSILSSDFIDEEINLAYTKLDDAKAELVNCLSNRLIDHINALYPDIKALNLNYADYTKVYEIFSKATDSNSFLNLWKDKFPNNTITSIQENYEKIKGEAMYYIRVCNYLYKEDKYDIFKI